MSGDRVIEHPGAYADAALYDLSYSWLDLDLDFYVRTAKAANGPVLEVACGTGRVLLPTLAAGVDIDGFDREPAMIAALERKAAARGLRARVSVADMRDFALPRHYALVTIPFRSFLHLSSTEDQLRTLRAIHEHLEPGGSLVFNVFYPSPAIIAKKENRRLLEREFAHPESGRTVAFWDTTTYDRPAQRLSVEREVITQGAPGEPDQTILVEPGQARAA